MGGTTSTGKAQISSGQSGRYGQSRQTGQSEQTPDCSQPHVKQGIRQPPSHSPPRPLRPPDPMTNIWYIRDKVIETLETWTSALKSLTRDNCNNPDAERLVQQHLERMEEELHAWNTKKQYDHLPNYQWTGPNKKDGDDPDLSQMSTKLHDKDEKIKELTKMLDDMKRSKENLEKEKNEVLSRLSEVSSKQLRDKNPNIADLSDKNRPTKLAERYTELYDTEWTDCFQSLTKTDMADRQAVDVLHSALLDVYCNCKSVLEKQTLEVANTVTRILSTHKMNESTSSTERGPLGHCVQNQQESKPTSTTAKKTQPSSGRQGQVKPINKKDQKQPKTDVKLKLDENLKMPLLSEAVEYRQSVETFLKDIVPCMVHGFKLNCVNLFKTQQGYQNDLVPFVSKCAELCLYMLVQPQPMVFMRDAKENDKYDPAFYRAYTNSGPVIDYVVWPALLLHQDGPLLLKGVAQGKDIPKEAHGTDEQKVAERKDNPKCHGRGGNSSRKSLNF